MGDGRQSWKLTEIRFVSCKVCVSLFLHHRILIDNVINEKMPTLWLKLLNLQSLWIVPWPSPLKILLSIFKCLYGLAPNYLIELISIKKHSRYSLWSNESLLLELPSTKTRPTLGDRAFQSAAPYLWNALPSTICDIKTLDTKTHFFNLAFKEFFFSCLILTILMTRLLLQLIV